MARKQASGWIASEFGSQPQVLDRLTPELSLENLELVLAEAGVVSSSGFGDFSKRLEVTGTGLMLVSGPKDSHAEGVAKVGRLGHLSTPLDQAEFLEKVSLFLERVRLRRRIQELETLLEASDSQLSASQRGTERAEARLVTTHTELETATGRLVHAEQLAAVGRVTAGIADEIGNQLALVGYAEAIRARVEDPELAEFADVIINAQRRLSATVEHIRDFASGQNSFDKEPADLVAIVDEAIELLRYDEEFKNRKIQRNYLQKPIALLHREQFTQVVINLVTNAVEATRDGGDIEVEVSREDGRAVLVVRDRGAGMTEDVLEQLGQPFFTTRGDNRSGLGVGICMRIVEEHGGTLSFRSKPGKGTKALVELPEVGEKA